RACSARARRCRTGALRGPRRSARSSRFRLLPCARQYNPTRVISTPEGLDDPLGARPYAQGRSRSLSRSAGGRHRRQRHDRPPRDGSRLPRHERRAHRLGAVVLDGAVIEEGAQVGAGALVAPGKVVPAGWLVMGVPAKPIRKMDAAELEDILKNARDYLELWHRDYRS